MKKTLRRGGQVGEEMAGKQIVCPARSLSDPLLSVPYSYDKGPFSSTVHAAMVPYQKTLRESIGGLIGIFPFIVFPTIAPSA